MERHERQSVRIDSGRGYVAGESPGGFGPGLIGADAALYTIDVRFGDVLGTNLYDHFGGFTVCVVAITVVYALILPGLFLVPGRLIATADGVVPPGVSAVS